MIISAQVLGEIDFEPKPRFLKSVPFGTGLVDKELTEIMAATKRRYSKEGFARREDAVVV